MIYDNSIMVSEHRVLHLRINNTGRLVLFTAFTLFCIQGTDLKISVIKLSELLLLIYFFYIRTKLSRAAFLLLCLFSVYLLNSIVVSVFTNFYPPSDATGGLKQPYLISVSRFMEIVACLGFVEFVRREMRYLVDRGISIKRIFDYLVIANCLLGTLYMLDLIAILLNIYAVDNSFFFYGSYRLMGTFAEGGPNGVCLAFIMCICLPQCSKLIKIIGFIFLSFLILLAQSKAAIGLLLIYSAIKIYKKLNLNLAVAVPLFFVGSVALLYVLSILLDSYVQSLATLDTLLLVNSDDPSIIMGRVAGLVISPNIIINNFWLGIGLGNYALVRNNPLYSGVFPKVALWDSPGLGGLVDLFIETGFIGFVSFIYVLFYIYRTLSLPDDKKINLVICFILPYICGVQLYFQYPWFALGYALFLTKVKT